METKEATNRMLQVLYYLIYFLMIIVAGLFYFLFSKKEPSEFPDLQSQFSLIVQYIVIGVTLAGVPGGLYLHKYYCNKLKTLTNDEDKLRKYKGISIIRLVLVSSGLLLGIMAFFMLGAYKPMIYCAAISAIALVFCKSSVTKIEVDLNLNS